MIRLIVVLISPSLAIYIREADNVPGGCFSPTLDNGWVESEPNILGNNFVGKFRCNPGFVLTGEETIKCRDGIWSSRPKQFPVCAALNYCDAEHVPKIARNGFHQQISYSANSIYRYKCNRGYHLVGPSSAYCTQSGWSVREAPVCTKKGCEAKELLVNGFEYGRIKSLHGGAVYRFTCFPGAVMEGSSTVFCDGTSWNGTKPECLAAPPPPSLSVIIDGVQVQNPAVSVGEKVTLACQNLGGSPAPMVAFYVNSEKVGNEAPMSATYTFIAEKHHDSARIFCAASNKAVQTPVSSLYKVLTIKYAASATYIKGEDTVNSENYARYTCNSDVSNPASNMSVKASDQNGDAVPVVVKKMPIMKARKGFTSSISFGILYTKGVKHVEIECKAENEIGQSFSTFITRVKATDLDNVSDEMTTPAQINSEINMNIAASQNEEPRITNKNNFEEIGTRVKNLRQASVYNKLNGFKDSRRTTDRANDDLAYDYKIDSSKIKAEKKNEPQLNPLKKMEGNKEIKFATKEETSEGSNHDIKESEEENNTSIENETEDETSYSFEEDSEEIVDHDYEVGLDEENWKTINIGMVNLDEEYEYSVENDNGAENEEENWNNFDNMVVTLESHTDEEYSNTDVNAATLNKGNGIHELKHAEDNYDESKASDKQSSYETKWVPIYPATDYYEESSATSDEEYNYSVENDNEAESEEENWNNFDDIVVTLESDTDEESSKTDVNSATLKKGNGIHELKHAEDNYDESKASDKQTQWVPIYPATDYYEDSAATSDEEYNYSEESEGAHLNKIDYKMVQLKPVSDEEYDASERFISTDDMSEEKSQSSEYYNEYNKNIIEESAFSQAEEESSHMALKSSNNLDNQAELSSKTLFSVSSARRLYFQSILISLLMVVFTKLR